VPRDREALRFRGLRSDLIDLAIAAHHGRIIKRTGDGAPIEFRRAVDAVRHAIEAQTGLIERNAGLPSDRRIASGVTVHLATSSRRLGVGRERLPLETRANLAPS
jgi:adenylate cyclase